jgi:hypothetical protein
MRIEIKPSTHDVAFASHCYALLESPVLPVLGSLIEMTTKGDDKVRLFRVRDHVWHIHCPLGANTPSIEDVLVSVLVQEVTP